MPLRVGSAVISMRGAAGLLEVGGLLEAVLVEQEAQVTADGLGVETERIVCKLHVEGSDDFLELSLPFPRVNVEPIVDDLATIVVGEIRAVQLGRVQSRELVCLVYTIPNTGAGRLVRAQVPP